MARASGQFREHQSGYSRGIADRYSEKKWETRYKKRGAVSPASSLDWVMYVEMIDYDACAEPLVWEGKPTEPEQSPMDLDRLARLWLRGEQCLATVPTVLLVGMYGAAAFSLLSIGPAWTGFLAGAVPVSALAGWAFSSSSPPRS